MAAPSFLRSDTAMWGVSLLALLALIDSIFNYISTGNGIHGTVVETHHLFGNVAPERPADCRSVEAP